MSIQREWLHISAIENSLIVDIMDAHYFFFQIVLAMKSILENQI